MILFQKSTWPLAKGHRFEALDALRGIAALTVVEYHLGAASARQFFPRGYLAVDFFFMLSGFVLSFAYQEKLDSGWPTWDFLKVRLVRLYPLYILGLVLGLSILLWMHTVHGVQYSGVITLAAIVFGMLILPIPPGFHGLGRLAFPLNIPGWSLSCEIAANIFHGLLIRRRGALFLAITICLSGAALLMADNGLFKPQFDTYPRLDIISGLLRVAFCYCIGIALYQVWKTGRFKVQMHPVLSALLLLAILAFPNTAHSVAVDFIIRALCLPLLLSLSIQSRIPSLLNHPAHMLGAASYAVYALHYPLLEIFERVWRKAIHRAGMLPIWTDAVSIAAIVTLSLFAEHFYDNPARTLLRGLLVRRPNTKNAEARMA